MVASLLIVSYSIKLKNHQINYLIFQFLTKSEENLRPPTPKKIVLDVEQGPPKDRMEELGSSRVLRNKL